MIVEIPGGQEVRVGGGNDINSHNLGGIKAEDKQHQKVV